MRISLLIANIVNIDNIFLITIINNNKNNIVGLRFKKIEIKRYVKNI